MGFSILKKRECDCGIIATYFGVYKIRIKQLAISVLNNKYGFVDNTGYKVIPLKFETEDRLKQDDMNLLDDIGFKNGLLEIRSNMSNSFFVDKSGSEFKY